MALEDMGQVYAGNSLFGQRWRKWLVEERKGEREEWSTGVDRNSMTTFFLDKNQCYKSNSVSSLYI